MGWAPAPRVWSHCQRDPQPARGVQPRKIESLYVYHGPTSVVLLWNQRCERWTNIRAIYKPLSYWHVLYFPSQHT